MLVQNGAGRRRWSVRPSRLCQGFVAGASSSHPPGQAGRPPLPVPVPVPFPPFLWLTPYLCLFYLGSQLSLGFTSAPPPPRSPVQCFAPLSLSRKPPGPDHFVLCGLDRPGRSRWHYFDHARLFTEAPLSHISLSVCLPLPCSLSLSSLS